MRKLTKKEFPYVFMSVALALLCNQIIYQDTRLITRYFHHWDIATPLDHTFRLIPWTLIIYFGCFAFWGISYAIIALQDDRQKSEQFFSAVAVSKILPHHSRHQAGDHGELILGRPVQEPVRH